MKAAIFPKVIDNKDSVLILGSFESIHNGHMKLIYHAKKYKKPISMMIIQNTQDLPGNSLPKYASIETRLENLSILGISKVSVIKFDENIRLLEGKDFLTQIMKATKATKIVVGHDFGCGVGKSYKSRQIAEDFDADIVPEYRVNGQKLGTSLLKEMVQTGEVDLIKEISPFPYIVNLRINEDMSFNFTGFITPHPGIYVVDAIINEMLFWGYIHVDMEGKSKLYLEDLNFKNKQFDARISLHKLSRIIISKNHDALKEEDQKRIKKYFSA